MKKLLSLLSLALCLIFSSPLFSQCDIVYGVNGEGDSFTINPLTGDITTLANVVGTSFSNAVIPNFGGTATDDRVYYYNGTNDQLEYFTVDDITGLPTSGNVPIVCDATTGCGALGCFEALVSGPAHLAYVNDPASPFFGMLVSMDGGMLVFVDPTNGCITSMSPVVGPFQDNMGNPLNGTGGDLAYDNSGNLYLITNPGGGFNGGLFLIDPVTGVATWIATVPGFSATGLTFLSDGSLLISTPNSGGVNDGSIYVFDFGTGMFNQIPGTAGNTINDLGNLPLPTDITLNIGGLSPAGPFIAGDMFSYTVTVCNEPSSENSTESLEVNVPIPAGFSVVGVPVITNPSGVMSYDPVTGLWVISDPVVSGDPLLVGDCATLTITLQVDTTSPVGSTSFNAEVTTSCFDIDSSPGNYEPGTQNEDDEDDFTIDVLDCVIGDGLILDFNVLCCGEQVLIDNDFANTSFDAVNYQLLWALTAGSSTVASAADVAAAIQIFTPGADGHSFIFTNTCTGGVSDLASGLYSFTPFIANIAGQIDDRCEAYGGTVELYVLSEIVVSNVVLVCLAGGGYSVTFDVSGGAPGVIAGAGYIVTDGGATSVTDNGGGNYTVTYPAGVDYLITIENSVNGQNQTGCPVTLEGLEITLPEANDWQLSVCEEVEGGSQGSFDLTSAEANILGAGSGVVTGWYEDAGLTISITTPTAFVNTTNPQLVYAEVTDPVTNCSAVAEVTLTVNSLPVVDITAGGCGHFAPVVLDAGSGAGWSYNWQPGGETTQTINAVEGYYEVTVTDENGCENTSHTEVYDPISIIVHPQGCGDNDSLSITIEGGQPDHPGTAVLGTSYTMTSYEVTSNIDGVLGNADGSGNFTIGSLSEGLHTITVSYEQLDEAGNPTGIFCTEMVEVAIYGPLELTIDSGCGYNNVSYIVTGGYTQFDEDHQGGSDGAEYTVNLTNPDGTAVFDTNGNFVGPVNSTYPHSNTFTDIGNSFYDITVTDWTTGCEVTATVEVFDTLRAEYTITDCLTNDVQVTATGGYAGSSYIPLNGPSNYTFNWYTATPPPGNTVIDQTNTTGTFTGFGPGTYYVEVIDNNLNTTGDCSIIIEVIIEEPLQLLTEYFCEDGIVATGGTAPYTYTLYESDGTTVVGTNTTGVFPGTEGTYYLEVTDANGCTTALTEIECLTNFVCDLDSTHDPICIDGLSFEVELNLTGSGTYTIDDGVNPALTGQGSGIITIGALPNGPYSITITSEIDPTCTVTLTGDVDCFQCDLVVDQLAECIDDDLYTVTLTITGTGTFTVDDGVNPPLTGQGAGVIVLGPYPSGNYNITVTSEIDGTCSTIVVGGQDCSVFECVVNANITATCLDENIYELDIDLVGNGSFTIDDGINPPITGQFTGTITVGPFPNGPYNITITSEEDINCVIVLNGLIDCSTSSPCDISAIVETICGLDDNFALSVLLTGTSTYEIMDNLTGMVILSGQVAGNIGVGTFPSGPYDITITDENDPNCSLTLTGEETCTFENCDLTVETEFLCSQEDHTLTITYIITGTGTFTIDDGVNPPATGQGSGSYSITYPETGVYSYNILITSETNSACYEVIQGNYSCGFCNNCDLAISAEHYCNGDGTFNVELTIDGSGTYDLFYDELYIHDISALTTSLSTGETAGTVILGPFSENNVITIGAVDQFNPACWASVSLNNACSECELDSHLSFTCNPDGTFNAVFNFTDAGDFQVFADDYLGYSFNQIVSGPASINLGPFNTQYDIWYFSTESFQEDCVHDYYGLIDCEACEPCDLSAEITTLCVDAENYEVSVNILGGGTYSITSNFHPTQTGLTAGSYVVGTFANGLHSITIQDENNPHCTQTFEGVDACSELPPCNIDVTSNLTCEGDDTYEIQLNFITAGDYTIFLNGIIDQSGTFSGPVSITGVANGPYSVLIVSNDDTSCSLLLEGAFVCSETVECDLIVTATPQCIDDENYEVVITITGTSSYSITDFAGNSLTGLIAGTYTMGPYPNGFYNLFIEDENNPLGCRQDLFGSFECLEPSVCDLSAMVSYLCEDNGDISFIITITGSGNYEIYSDFGTLEASGPAGAYIVVVNDGFYNISIQDVDNPDCSLFYTGNLNCEGDGDNECDLYIEAEPFCNSDGTFSIVLTINGTGSYDVDWDNGSMSGVPDTTMVIGPFGSGGYFVNVADPNAGGPFFECFQGIAGSFFCEGGGLCDLQANFDITCIDDTSYFIDVTFTGGSTYSLDDGMNPLQTGLPPGSYQLGPFTNGPYFISITDEADPSCHHDIEGIFSCSDTVIPCDLQVEMLTTYCEEDWEIVISGSSTYTIEEFVNGTTIITGASPGNYVLNTASGDVIFVITDDSNPSCQYFVGYGVDDFCPLDCDAIYNSTAICNGDGSYMIEVTIDGPDVYEVCVNGFFDNQIEECDSLAAGTHTFGPYTDDQMVVNFFGGCGGQAISNPCGISTSCDLVASAEAVCQENGSYELILTFSGTGTFDIFYEDNLGNGGILPGVGAGTHSLGLLGGTGYFIDIVSPNGNCSLFINGHISCEGGEFNCDLNASIEIECGEFGSDSGLLTINGTGTYTIDFGGFGNQINGAVASDSPITLDPIFGGFYNVQITDESNPNCFTSLFGSIPCFTQGEDCDLFASVSVNCIDSTSYELVINITGTGPFDVFHTFGDPILTGVNAGSYTVGPFSTANFSIDILSGQGPFGPRCFQNVFGSSPCALPSICDLTVTAEVECISNSSYTLIVEVGGSGVYDLFGGNDFLPGITAGTYTLGPLTDDIYFVNVNGQFDFECIVGISGAADCSVVGICDLNLSYETICGEDGDYSINLTISGSDTYDISVDGTLLHNAVAPGVHTLSGLPQGPITISVKSDGDAGCFQNIGSNGFCNPDAECDLSINSVAECLNADGFMVELTLSGSGVYSIDDGVNPPVSGVGAGQQSIGPISPGSYSITVSQPGGDCEEVITGVNNCASGGGCNFNASTTTQCITEGFYQVVIDLAGSGSFTIEDGINPGISAEAGQHVIGPIPNGAFTINISVKGDPDCFQTLSGANDCSGSGGSGSCDFSVDASTSCNGSDGFNIDITSSASPFSVDDGTNSVDGLSGTYTYGPANNGTYEIVVSANGCSQTLMGVKDCTGGENCEFSIVAEQLCVDNKAIYLSFDVTTAIALVASGGGIENFEIPESGSYLMGPFTLNSFSVVISAADNPACSLEFEVASNCVFGQGCGLSGLKAEVDCENKDAGTIDILLEFFAANGGNSYEVLVNDTTYSVESFGEGPEFIVLNDVPFEDEYLISLIDAAGCVLGIEIGPGLCLPPTAIELLSYSGEVRDAGNQLNWITVTEMDNDYFELSRSQDGVQFEVIAKVRSKGDGPQQRKYTHLDDEAPIGRSYYKLRVFENNGSVQEIEQLVILQRNDVMFIDLFPNPVQNQLTIRWNKDQGFSSLPSAQQLTLEVFDETGRLIERHQFNGPKLILDTSVWPQAVYFLQMSDGVQTITERVVKE